MSDYKIPMIEPSIDYTKVPAIHQKRTIAFINHFIINIVTFLNKFALSCEEKLFNFENKLQKVEASLQILESRLSSISGLEDNATSQTNCNTVENEESKKEEVEKVETKANELNVDEPSEPKIEETEMQLISEDPLYQKYFKMVHVGVPKPAVKMKMQQEGLDPSLLDDPSHLVSKVKPDATAT